MTSFKVFFPSGYNIKDIKDDNIDINIILSDRSVFFATLFTIRNIHRLMQDTKDLYFWSTDMIILKDLNKETIKSAIFKIIDDGYLDLAFSKIGTIESVFPENKSFDEIDDI